jgi:hypothetical protein
MGLFVAACASLALFAFLFVALAGAKPEAGGQDASAYVFWGASLPRVQLAAAGAGLSALFSAFCLGYIVYSFKKTVSAEIFFFSFWALSLGLEVLRPSIHFLSVSGAPANWLFTLSRALVFSRSAGLLAIFASSLYATGIRYEKIGSVAMLMTALATAIAMSMPLNTDSFAPTLEIAAGYRYLNDGFFFVAAATTIANFVYSSVTRGEAAYRYAALGCALALAGQRMLTTSLYPLFMVLGFALAAGGAWIVVSRLHAYYLWQ